MNSYHIMEKLLHQWRYLSHSLLIAGTPGTPVIFENVSEVESAKYKILWTTPSFSNIQEHMLIYKQVKVDVLIKIYRKVDLKLIRSICLELTFHRIVVLLYYSCNTGQWYYAHAVLWFQIKVVNSKKKPTYTLSIRECTGCPKKRFLRRSLSPC